MKLSDILDILWKARVLFWSKEKKCIERTKDILDLLEKEFLTEETKILVDLNRVRTRIQQLKERILATLRSRTIISPQKEELITRLEEEIRGLEEEKESVEMSYDDLKIEKQGKMDSYLKKYPCPR